MPDFTAQMAAMIGLGVGIDYALFIVTRYREGLDHGLERARSIVEAIDTSGRAVLFAGTPSSISLLGLFLMGLAFVHGSRGRRAIVGVLMMMAASLTLLPAFLGFAGRRVDDTSRAALIAVHGLHHRSIVGVVSADPAPFLGALALAVVVYRAQLHRQAVRARRSRTAPRSRASSASGTAGAASSSTARGRCSSPAWRSSASAGDPAVLDPARLRRHRQPARGPDRAPGLRHARRGLRPRHRAAGLVITVAGPAASDQAALDAFAAQLAATEGVAASPPPVAIQLTPDLAIVQLYPSTSPQDEATTQLVQRLRDDVIPASGLDARVGGAAAGAIDFADYIAGRLPMLIGAVLILSFILLMAVFRSLLVPLKAVILNLMSIGAAYGVLVGVFQWGHGKALIGVDKNGPIEAWIPMMMFAIVFGLSMDYEVFLLSRIKEHYDKTARQRGRGRRRGGRHRARDHRRGVDHGVRVHVVRDR